MGVQGVTKNDNYYEKSIGGKLTGFIAGSAVTGGLIYRDCKRGGEDSFIKYLTKDFANSKAAKIKTISSIAGIIAIFVGIPVCLGAITDAIINSGRRNKAAEKAEQVNQVEENKKTEE